MDSNKRYDQSKDDMFFEYINNRSKINRVFEESIAKAEEEYEESMARIEEDTKRTNRMFGVVFISIALILAFAIGVMVSKTTAAEAKEAESPSMVETEVSIEVSSEPESEPESIPVREYYDIPLSEDLQEYIFIECEERGIKPEIVFGMIERESQFQADIIGDSGNSFGLMQIQPYWHSGRMEKLGVTDLLDPFQNITVGIDYLAELILKYDGSIDMALTAYNAGCTGAYNNYFSRGIYCSEYSMGVIENAAALEG